MSDNHWQEPLRWNAEAERAGVRARVFCASMADVFDEEAPEGQRERLWPLIRQTPMLDWQILTKRPQLIEQNLPEDWGNGYDNVWLGTSVEDQRVVHRIDSLRNASAKLRFLSLEPLIGPLPDLNLEGIGWAIVGAESGRKVRKMEFDWVRDIRDQCIAADVAFFFKQDVINGKKVSLPELDGIVWNQIPDFSLV
jgi:protein gp37